MPTWSRQAPGCSNRPAAPAYGRKGKAYGFRYKDWTDYQGTGEPCGTGDGAEIHFQLTKRYSSGNYDYDRSIFKPVSGSVVIYVNGVEQGSGWSISTTTGVITFDAPPTDTHPVTADFEFDVPVRFDVDQLSLSLDEYGINSAIDIRLVELRIQEVTL